jgi:hypothetical protein
METITVKILSQNLFNKNVSVYYFGCRFHFYNIFFLITNFEISFHCTIVELFQNIFKNCVKKILCKIVNK